MEFAQFEHILGSIKYKRNYKIRWYRETNFYDFVMIEMKMHVQDVYQPYGEKIDVIKKEVLREDYISSMDEYGLKEWIYYQIQQFELHETQEWLRFGKDKYVEPH